MCPKEIEERRPDYPFGQFARYRCHPDHAIAPRTVDEAIMRLGRLACHLVSHRGHAAFDFSEVVRRLRRPDGTRPDEGMVGCDTAGCAIGEMPFCWPNVFGFTIEFPGAIRVELRWGEMRSYHRSMDLAAVWFGVDVQELSHLFSPKFQTPELFGGQQLSNDAPPYKVVENIWAYIETRYGVDRMSIVNRVHVEQQPPSPPQGLSCTTV